MAEEGGSEGWSDVELEACLRAYLEMLGAEIVGQKYNKAAVNRALREGTLNARSESSVEFRMQNISSFLDLRGERYIEGYKPMQNIGPKISARLTAIYERIGEPEPEAYAPSLDEPEVRRRAAKLRVSHPNMPPMGNSKPARSSGQTIRYERSPAVVAFVLGRAKGICECCGNPAPFLTDSGDPFLEVHHVQPLADGGPDTVENAVAVCPNCHRACHYSVERVKLARRLERKLIDFRQRRFL